MKEIGITMTILETIKVPDNSSKEEIQKAVDNFIVNVDLNAYDLSDIEWEILS